MILLRHGQSEFNLHFTATRQDPGITDPALTPLGRTQAEEAAAALRQERLVRMVVSPYTRTLQTAAPIAGALGLAPEVVPLVRERFAFTCDVGSPASVLAQSWPQHDFADLEEVWWPPERESEAALQRRARAFRDAVRERADWQETLVVTHWGFILALTGQSVANGQWLRWDQATPLPRRIVWTH